MAGRIIGGPDRPTPATLAGRPCLERGAVTQRAVVGAVGADIPRSVGGSKLAISMGTHGLCTA
jgi:hypothetical protein